VVSLAHGFHLFSKVMMKKIWKRFEHIDETQDQVLKYLVKLSRNTIFGRRHDIGSVRTFDDLVNRTPLTDYSYYTPYIDAIKHGLSNALSMDPPFYWIETSGTTGEPKLFPLNHAAMEAYSQAVRRGIVSFAAESKEHARIIDGKILAYGAASNMGTVAGYNVGFISGVLREFYTNRFFKKKMIPSIKILNIENYEERMLRAAAAVINENVTIVSGVAPFVLSLMKAIANNDSDFLNMITSAKVREKFKKLFEKYGHLYPKDIWENLQMFAHSGVQIAPYKPVIRKLLGDVVLKDMYFGTEGGYAINIDSSVEGTHLNIDLYHFQFVQKDSEGFEKERYSAADVRKGFIYELIVSTPMGLFSYEVGDLVMVLKTDPLMVQVVGRSKHTINLAGEKLTEHQVIKALDEVSEKLGAEIEDFTFIGDVIDGEAVHILGVEFKKPTDLDSFIDEFDKSLRSINEIYDVLRTTRTLLKPRLVVFPKGSFKNYMKMRILNGSPAGQMKPAHMNTSIKLLNELENPESAYEQIGSS